MSCLDKIVRCQPLGSRLARTLRLLPSLHIEHIGCRFHSNTLYARNLQWLHRLFTKKTFFLSRFFNPLSNEFKNYEEEFHVEYYYMEWYLYIFWSCEFSSYFPLNIILFSIWFVLQSLILNILCIINTCIACFNVFVTDEVKRTKYTLLLHLGPSA